MHHTEDKTANGPVVITESNVKSCTQSQINMMKNTMSKLPGCNLTPEALSTIIQPKFWYAWEVIGVTIRGRINEDIHGVVRRLRRVFEEANRSIAQVGYDDEDGKYLERLLKNLRKDETVSRLIPTSCKAMTIHRAICTLAGGRASYHFGNSPESVIRLSNRVGEYTKEHQTSVVQLFHAMDMFMVITKREGWKVAVQQGRPLQQFFDSAFPLPDPRSSTPSASTPSSTSAASSNDNRTSTGGPADAALRLAQSEIEGYKLKLQLLEQKHNRLLQESRSYQDERDSLKVRCRELETHFRNQAIDCEVWRNAARECGDPKAAHYPAVPLMDFVKAPLPRDGAKTYPFHIKPRP